MNNQASSPDCNYDRRIAGLGAPRTCAKCGLGPCHNGHMLASGVTPPRFDETAPPNPKARPPGIWPRPKPEIPASLFPPALRRLRDISRWNGSFRATRDDVAGHSYYVAIYARSIGQLVGWKGSVGMLLQCALFHDMEEIATGDMLFHVKRVVIDQHKYEAFASKYMNEKLPNFSLTFTDDVLAIVHAADKLDCVFSTATELMQGNRTYESSYKRIMQDFFDAFMAMCKTLGLGSAVYAKCWHAMNAYIDAHHDPENYHT